jgi:hypothetical protein
MLPRLVASVAPALLVLGCVSFAAAPPMITLGGPQTAGAGGSQVGMGVGSGASLFPGAHSGGNGYLARYRYGLTENTDVGVDFMGVLRSNKMTLTGKIDGRRRLGRHWAAELGLGAADDSDGKSLSGEAALIVGTERQAAWDFYAAARAAVAFGIVQNQLDPNDPTVRGAQDALVALGSAGATARISDSGQFIFEGGMGTIKVANHDDLGLAIYLGVGLLFHIGASR